MPPRAPALRFSASLFVCPRCCLRSTTNLQHRGRLRCTSAFAPPSKWAHLINKRLIRLSGPDAANFLHNIIPAKILGVGTAPIYTVFLAPQGRILQDVFIYPPSWEGEKRQEWLIEVDAESASDLLKHLKKHKLRSKFTMELVNEQEAGVWYRWPQQSESSHQKWTRDGVRAGGNDSRPGMGTRLILNQSSEEEVRANLDGSDPAGGSLEEYQIHRIINGLAEGQKEIISGHALPQESNIDFLGGIDFHKGCYLGQELTIRTHHTGVVRKRILPCQIYDESQGTLDDQIAPEFRKEARLPLPPPESNLSKLTTRKGRSTGKLLGGIGNIGLALCRLEMMTDIQLTADTTNFDSKEEYRVQWEGGDEGQPVQEIHIKPFVPPWVRQGIEQSLKRKEKRPKKREEYEEEEVD